MVINFKRLWAKNYQSIEFFELIFKPGKHLITGTNHSTDFAESNGSGKSSIVEPIPWCIYKKSLRGKDISREGKGKCEVGLEFSISGDTYELTRYLINKKDSRVEFKCNGEDITPRNNENIEDVIERTIGIPYDLFVITVVVLQGLPINLSTMTPTIRKGVLETLLGVDNWSTFTKIFKKKKEEISQDYEQVSDVYLASKSDMVAKNAELETLQEATEVVEQDDIEDLRDIKKQLSETRARMSHLENLREACSTEDSDVIRDNLNTIRLACSTIENDIEDLIGLIEDGICPTCGQNYPSSMIEVAKDKLNRYDEKLPVLKGKEANLQSLLDTIVDLDNDIFATKREMRIIQSTFNSMLDTMNNREERNTDSIDTVQKDLDRLVKEVNELDSQVTLLENKMNGYEYILSLLLPSSAFRTKVLERYLAYVNNILAEVAPNVLDNIVVSLAVNKNASGIDIDINGGKTGYYSLSGGEKRRVDLIIILSLQKFLLECANIRTNLLVFDEIFDALDPVGISCILNCIDMLFEDTICVYIITQQLSFRSSFDSFIEVEKVDGISTIIEEGRRHEV